MGLLKRIKDILNKPYPGPESFAAEVKGQAIAALIVFGILYILKPFGMAYYEDSQLLVAGLFGLTAFVSGSIVGSIILVIFKVRKDVESYTFGHWIIEVVFLLIGIAIGNTLLVHFFLGAHLNLSNFLNMLLGTVLIGLFPVAFFGLKNQLKLERRHNKNALEISDAIHEHDFHEAPEQIVLAVESMQNYIHIYTLEHGMLSKETERKTLSAALRDFKHPDIIQCHRSYLVNLSQVQNVTGNAQGLKLDMAHSECPTIPVSRSYISTVRNLLEHNA